MRYADTSTISGRKEISEAYTDNLGDLRCKTARGSQNSRSPVIFYTILIASLLLTMCSISTSSRASVKDLDDANAMLSIIRYGSLAGNSHNTQPWKVKILNESQFELRADFSRKLHVVDDSSRGLYISLGAFIENCVQAAGALGYKAEVEYSLKGRGATIITLSPDKPSDSAALKRIELRRTLRSPFSNRPLLENDIQKLLGDGGDSLHYYPYNDRTGRYISEHSLLAYAQQARDEKAKAELARWIRFSKKDVSEKRDGLTTAGMQIGALAGFFVGNFMKPEDSMKDSFVEQGIKKAEAQIANCSGWIVISQESDDPVSWMKTGRLYERINLKCRDLKIGCHPINALIEEDNFEKDVEKNIPLKGKIQMLMRVGYVDTYPAPVSKRRDLKDIIVR